VILLSAHALIIVLLTLEANDYFALRGGDASPDGLVGPGYARQMTFSIIWAVYAIGMVLSGFVRKFKPVRIMALVVLSVAILKVFLYDLGFLEGIYRILSFLVLGLILVGVSFLYQRFRSRLLG
jgi:uncharacterized membrane protein